MGYLVSPSVSLVLRIADHPIVVFAASKRSQCIQAFDIRAMSMLYELSTGNNEVTDDGLVWDPIRQQLIAMTNCFADRRESSGHYRPAVVPRPQQKEGERKEWYRPGKTEYQRVLEMVAKHDEEMVKAGVVEPTEDAVEDSDAESDDSEEDLIESRDIRWPRNAKHKENYFGHLWSATRDALSGFIL